MSRLFFLFIVALAWLVAACSSTNMKPASDLRVVQTTASYGDAHYRTYWDEGDTVYVRVSYEAPSAVLLSEPSPWADPVAFLELGQQLEVIEDSTTNYVLVATSYFGDRTEGWVWRPVLQSRPPTIEASDKEFAELEGAEFADVIIHQDGSHHVVTSSTPPFKRARMPSENLNQAMQAVSDFEAGRARALADRPALARYRAFGKTGGLIND